jgi:hypothetical protein
LVVQESQRLQVSEQVATAGEDVILLVEKGQLIEPVGMTR